MLKLLALLRKMTFPTFPAWSAFHPYIKAKSTAMACSERVLPARRPHLSGQTAVLVVPGGGASFRNEGPVGCGRVGGVHPGPARTRSARVPWGVSCSSSPPAGSGRSQTTRLICLVVSKRPSPKSSTPTVKSFTRVLSSAPSGFPESHRARSRRPRSQPRRPPRDP